jgi:hypothetical protein
MKNNYNILTIGDIHGRSIWKDIIFGGETEFFFWKSSIEHGYLKFDDNYDFHKFDKIIFVGDYVDSYDIDNATILENLEDIVLFAKTYPDLVVLLLGNHDVQYIVQNECCSGYRGEMRAALNRIFNDNKNLFKIAFLDVYKGENRTIKTLWTHAGVTKGWHTGLLRDVNSPRYKHTDFFIGSDNWKIDKLLNVAWNLKVDNLYNVDNSSGGLDLWAGPLWVRPHILDEYYLEGYDQVVGHTPQSAVYSHCPLDGVESNPNKLDVLTYTDALGHGDFYEIKRIK